VDILRTPEERFESLPGFPYAPHYTTITDADGTPIRIHHVDEGPRDAPPILLMHGNPTWSYLYRRMIPGLLETGRRVIAVDLVGCGRSDKPAARADYTLARHYDWMEKWLLAMDLKDITLFCQDWGGTIGLYLVSRHPDRFARVVASNTGLPTGGGESDFMKMWVGMMREAVAFPWNMLTAGMTTTLSEAEIAAYRAPYPTPAYEAALLEFPALITVQPDNPGTPINRAAWERLQRYSRPFLTLFGELDPVARGWEALAQANIAGARGQDHAIIPGAGHFIQEDAADELVRRIRRFLELG
jgi:haloalkane dehalogenase